MNLAQARIAGRLVSARREARALPLSLASLPGTLEESYAFQSALIELWDRPIAGWKVGRVLGAEAKRWDVDRFVGPIFAGSLVQAGRDHITEFPAIAGGTSAFEAELLAELHSDVLPRFQPWSSDEAAKKVGQWRIGIEIAGCPVPGISAIGALGSISAFGNNFGVIVGASIGRPEPCLLDQVACRTIIDDDEAGTGRAGNLPGGPLGALAFALNHFATRKVTLPAGCLIATGAITGVHPVRIGQRCTAHFGTYGAIDCVAVSYTHLMLRMSPSCLLQHSANGADQSIVALASNQLQTDRHSSRASQRNAQRRMPGKIERSHEPGHRQSFECITGVGKETWQTWHGR